MTAKAIRGRAPAAAWMAVALGASLVASALGCAGCRQKDRASDLERFQDRFAALPEAQRVDTLRTLALGRDRTAALASFGLGNIFARQAGERAAETGWSVPEAVALLDSAQARLERAVALDSTFVEALVNLGSVHDDRAMAIPPEPERQAARKEQLDRAEAAYQRALAISPNDPKARSNLGSLYQRQGRTADALAQFQTVLADDPRDPLAHYNLAILFAEERMYREAIREWEAAAEADPEGDIGQRSRENIRIVNELLSADLPAGLDQPAGGPQP